MRKYLKLAGLTVFIVIVALITFFAARWVISLNDPVNLETFQAWVESLGAGGWLLLLLLQYAQIVVAFVPGGPMQIVAGALFGPLSGLAVCVLGTVLATATVFWLVSRYGRRVIALFVDANDTKKYDFLHNESKIESLTLLLFFIPGTPKDALTYLFALTDIKMTRFLLLSTIARLPAMLTSILAGDSITDGQWGKALVMFIIMTAVAAAGLCLQHIFKKYLRGKKSREI